MAQAPQPESPDNRRKFPRMRDSCRLKVRPLAGFTPPGGGMDAVTVNISGGGLCFRSEAMFAIGDFVAVEMAMPEFSSPVVALGRVAWIGGAAPPCDIGIEFWWVGWGDDTAQRAIADYIKSELRGAS